MNEIHHLEQTLKRLRLPGIIGSLDMRCREARENDLGYLEFLSFILQDEIINRDANNLQKRIKAAGFSFGCTLEEFDFNFNRGIFPPATIRDLATCIFISKAQNITFCGPPGIGKSHISQGLGHEACRRNMDVLFRKTSKMLNILTDVHNPKRSSRLLKKIMNCNLLILDDFAFRKYDQREAEFLYVIADERLGKHSTVLTSNRPPDDWYSVFPDPVIGGAILDRFVSGAIKILTSKGKSYRKENPARIKIPVDKDL